MTHPLIAKYGDPLVFLDSVPRMAGEVYRKWADVSPEKSSLSRRERNERRWLGLHLEHLSREGKVVRRVITDNERTVVAFWREAMGPTAASRDQPAGPAPQPGHGRYPDGRGVGQ